MTRSRISDAVEQAVFLPTSIAYICLVVGYLRTGLAFYLIFVIGAYFVGWFKRIAEWPLISKIIWRVVRLCWAWVFFSTQNFRSGMLAPGIIYYVVSLVGVFALKPLDND